MKNTSSSSICLLLCCFISFYRISMADSQNLFDTCPTAAKRSTAFINGFLCKNPTDVSPSDFASGKLTGPVDTGDRFSSSVIMVTAAEFPGLNTLGLSIARSDLGIDGGVSLHSHPRATETFFVNQGIVLAGFIDTKNRLFQRFLKAGDVIVFPKGLLHFCLNSGYEPATIFSIFNAQNPGMVTINGAMFEPAAPHSDLQLKKKMLKRLKSLTSLSNLKFNHNVTFPTYVTLRSY